MIANFSVKHKWHDFPLLEYEFASCRMDNDHLLLIMRLIICTSGFLYYFLRIPLRLFSRCLADDCIA